MERFYLANTKFIQKAKNLYKKYKIEKSGFRYSLIDVSIQVDQEHSIKLAVLVQGIKKQILRFKPDDIIYNDELLSEFSPGDIRAITYLSFQKYLQNRDYSLVIEGQILVGGETIFKIKDLIGNNSFEIKAKKLYQHYDYLSKFSKKEIIVIIATAVQEQTVLDIQSIERP